MLHKVYGMRFMVLASDNMAQEARKGSPETQLRNFSCLVQSAGNTDLQGVWLAKKTEV